MKNASWYHLDQDRLAILNSNKAYTTRNECGFKHILPFKAHYPKEKNAEIFITATERLYSDMQRILEEEERQYRFRPVATSPAVQEMLSTVCDYKRSFGAAFNRDECKQSTEGLPCKLYECYQNLVYFEDRVCEFIAKEKELDAKQTRIKEQEGLRMMIEFTTMHISEGGHVDTAEQLMTSYERKVDVKSPHYLRWKARQLARITAWKERVVREENERHEKELERIERLRSSEMVFHEEELRSFDVQEIVHSHIETHVSKCPPDLHCEACNYTARSLSAYKQHMSTKKHTVPKREYVCECCNYQARDKSNLEKHFASKKHQENSKQD